MTNTMRVDVINIKDIPEGLKQEWLKIQTSNPCLMNPFFHPELFVAVAKYYPDVYAALLYKGNDLGGILPFKKDQKAQSALPIRFCNYEGIIASSGQEWDIDLILKKIGLCSWNFDALVNFKDIRFKRGDSQERQAFGIDLTEGLDKYWAYIQTKKVRLKDLNDKRRKLGIIKGPLRFVPNCYETRTLQQFVQWIRLRYNHDEAWIKETTEVLQHIYHMKTPGLEVFMPALYAGDELVAVDFHIRYQDYLGGLLRTFNPNFEKFSVGVLLLHDLINEHKALHYNKFDLGPEPFQYKLEYSNSTFPTIKGNYRADCFKEQIKSINLLHQSLLPIARIKGMIVNKLSGSK